MRETFVAITFFVFPFLMGCSDEAPTPDDGKFHPPPSGEHTTEALACKALVDAHSAHLLSIGCAGTSRTCPGFLRAEFGVDCQEYDKGSVDGCVAYYQSQTTCQDLSAALDICVITAYPGTTSAGCP
jgi:hypothetical protein